MRSTTASSVDSVCPGKLLMRHTNALSPGSYFARPLPTTHFAEAAVGGIGILMTTFVAFLSSKKSPITLMFTANFDLPEKSCI